MPVKIKFAHIGAAIGLVLSGIVAGSAAANHTTPISEWRSLAEQGDAEAQANLGGVYFMGRHVPKDYAEAAKWYGLSADHGNANAQTTLGVMYFMGLSVPKDYVQAHMWLSLSIANPVPGVGRDQVVKNRDKLATKMTTAQIDEAEKLAREWTPRRSGRQTPQGGRP